MHSYPGSGSRSFNVNVDKINVYNVPSVPGFRAGHLRQGAVEVCAKGQVREA